jgi:hypothetical protein
MVALTVVRVVGIVITFAGIALVRREREDAADSERSVRAQVVALWIAVAVAVVGAAVSVWAIFAR